MQKDVHFYLTYAMCKLMGIENAELIAWANQRTDEVTWARLYEIQTQSGVFGNWFDKQIQLSVLIAFHFIPGDDQENPWMTTECCSKAQTLLTEVIASGNPFKIGIALHSFQDTFSHQGFSGWDEKLNSCFPWYRMFRQSTPNIGHTELGIIPDVVDYSWTDPRNDKEIVNRERVSRCISAMCEMFRDENYSKDMRAVFSVFLNTKSYDKRKETLRRIIGSPVKYSELNKKHKGVHREQFSQAATKQLSVMMNLVADLPRKETEEDG